MTIFILPELECQNCVLQWKYIAGNNWGICKDGSGAVGCGPQEEFRACSDVAIGKGSVSAIPSLKPPVKIKPTTEKWPTERPDDNENEIDHDHDDHNTQVETNEEANKPNPVSNFYGAFIAMFTFFLVLLAIAAIYIYYYHGDFLKQILRRGQNSQNQKVPLDGSSASSIISTDMLPPLPIRPPRTKRLSQTLRDIPQNSSSILGGDKEAV